MEYIPYISGFTDFIEYHSNGSPIYMVDHHLYAGLDMLTDISTRYNFTFANSKRQIEKAIKENIYMFNVIPTDEFYYPNDNMFSGDNSQYGIKGYILTVKDKYRGR